MNKDFTSKQLEDWKAYERVRKGGQWNMFDPRTYQATGLKKQEYSFVMENFSELKKAVEND